MYWIFNFFHPQGHVYCFISLIGNLLFSFQLPHAHMAHHVQSTTCISDFSVVEYEISSFYSSSFFPSSFLLLFIRVTLVNKIIVSLKGLKPCLNLKLLNLIKCWILFLCSSSPKFGICIFLNIAYMQIFFKKS